MRLFDRMMVGPLERLLYLKTVPLFHGLRASELAVFAEHATEVRFRRGKRLLQEGRAVDAFFIVVHGTVATTRHGEAIRTYGAGDSVGVIPLLAGARDGVDARALTDVLALRVSGATCFDVFEDQFAIYNHALRVLCRLLRSERRQLRPRDAIGRVVPIVDGRPELVSRLLELRAAIPFTGSSFDGLAQLAQRVDEIEFPSGTTVWDEDAAADAALVIRSGRIECRVDDTRFVRAAGCTCGFADLLSEQARSYSARAGTDVVALHIDRDTLLDVFEDQADLAEACIRHVARRLLAVIDQRAAAGDDHPESSRPTTLPGIG